MRLERYLWTLLAVAAAALVLVSLPRGRVQAQAPSPPATPAPAPTATTIPAAGRKPHAPPQPGEIREMTIQQLGNFDYDPEAHDSIPADVRQLDGLRVRLHGFMIPMDQTLKITRFAFVPTLGNCCFGRPPAMQHMIVVDCPKGHEVDFDGDQLLLEGTLHVKETKMQDYVVSLFQLSCDKLKPAPQQ